MQFREFILYSCLVQAVSIKFPLASIQKHSDARKEYRLMEWSDRSQCHSTHWEADQRESLVEVWSKWILPSLFMFGGVFLFVNYAITVIQDVRLTVKMFMEAEKESESDIQKWEDKDIQEVRRRDGIVVEQSLPATTLECLMKFDILSESNFDQNVF